jgi:DHA2 family multidrug resistance protein
MLQSLYGYTATDAGLVVGPGAFVIVALTPLIVWILPKVGTKPLIFTGYIIFALAMSALKHSLPTEEIPTT